MAIPKNGKKKKTSLVKTEKEIETAMLKGSQIGPYFDPDMALEIFREFRAKGLAPREAQKSMIKQLLKMQESELREYDGRFK